MVNRFTSFEAEDDEEVLQLGRPSGQPQVRIRCEFCGAKMWPVFVGSKVSGQGMVVALILFLLTLGLYSWIPASCCRWNRFRCSKCSGMLGYRLYSLCNLSRNVIVILVCCEIVTLFLLPAFIMFLVGR